MNVSITMVYAALSVFVLGMLGQVVAIVQAARQPWPLSDLIFPTCTIIALVLGVLAVT